MKLLILFSALPFLMLVGCEKQAVEDDPWPKCQSQIQSQLTNDVVGYQRTIRMDIHRSDPNPENWKADVVLEYINSHGGIDRTNLPYRCYHTNDWQQDSEVLYRRAMDKYTKE